MSDWREIMGATPLAPFENPTRNPQNPPAKPSSADIAYESQTGDSEVLAPASPVAVELITPLTKPTEPLLSVLSVSDAGVSSSKAADAEAPEIIEAIFRSAAVTEAARQPSALVDHQFPPCPECGSRRYWISRGKVMCGSKTCFSAVRFVLTSIQFHAIN